MQAFRLRIELPDRPGALASLSAAIARHDANIVSVDIHEVEGPNAIDDIVVYVPDGWDPSRLSAALAEESTASLVSAQRLSTNSDAVLAVLRSCLAMATASTDELDGVCEAALSLLVPGDAVWLAGPADAATVEAGRLALETRDTTILGSDDTGGRTPAESIGWVLAAPDDAIAPSSVAFIARPGHLRFSASEIERVDAVLRLRRTLAG